MDRMIYLSLLLATFQQPSAQDPHVKVTFEYLNSLENWSCSTCPDVKDDKELKFNKIGLGEKIVCSSQSDSNQHVRLNLTTDATKKTMYLSVLLATIQQPSEPSDQLGIKVTFKFKGGWNVNDCCKDPGCGPLSNNFGVTLLKNTLTFGNLASRNHGVYLCNGSDSLNLTKDFNTTRSGANVSGEINGLKFYNETKSWIGALEYCKAQNSTLVELTNETVLHAVNSFLKNKTNQMREGVWIGLERSIFGCHVPWKWVSGSEADNPQWNKDHPVDRYNNHCGKIIWAGVDQNFTWLDERCHKKLPFICE